MQLKAQVVELNENTIGFDIDGYTYSLPKDKESMLFLPLGSMVVITVEPEVYTPPPYTGEIPEHTMVQ